MDYQKTLFSQYHETRSALLDPADKEKIAWFQFYFDKVYKAHFKSLPYNARILELGCNKGFLLAALQKEGYENLTGVDLSTGDLSVARKLLPEASFFEEDIFSFLEKHPDSFDCIVLKALIEHIRKEQILPFLEKLKTSLKPGGLVLIDVQNSDWLFGLHDRYVDFTHEAGFTQESLRQIMLLYFNNVSVVPTQSPYWCMSRKDTIKHKIARKLLSSLLRWAEPEAPSWTERLLIATGKKIGY
ncbi:class I SAM-dependent methyltransferase [Candidatus Dependentiae bacterium]|nr:class I SAM-dependent methyltransferase [Candidatus Dependentiae bacterium]